MNSFKIRFVRTETVIDRMQFMSTAEDRDNLIDSSDSLRRRMKPRLIGKKRALKQQAKIVSEGGIEVLVDMLKIWKEDEIVLRSLVRTLATIALMPGDEIARILDLGAYSLIEDAMAYYDKDRGMKKVLESLIKVFLDKGGTVAIKDIKKHVAALEFIQKETLVVQTFGEQYRHKKAYQSVDQLNAKRRTKRQRQDPILDNLDWFYALTYKECAEGIVNHMARYQAGLLVQEAGCDALVEFAKCTTDIQVLVQSDACGAVVRALHKFITVSRVVWKACASMYEMCHRHKMLAGQLGKRGAIEGLVEAWKNMAAKKDYTVQQQIIWALGALSVHPKNVDRFRKSYDVAVIFKYILIDIPREQRLGKADEGAIGLIPPVPISRLFTHEEIEKYATPPPEEEEEKPKQKYGISFFRPKSKKPKFGRAGEEKGNGDGESGLL